VAGWTKADYDAAYSIRVERYFGGHPPDRPELKVNYHKWGMQPILAARWAKLVPALGLLSTDYICVAGCGFGWGVDALIAESGATCVGVDVSDYIAAEKDNTEEAELRANVIAIGLDPDTGRGLELMGHIYDGQPRANVVVLQTDMSSANERQQIRAALGGNWPSHTIFEDLVDDTWTDTDIIDARNVGSGFGGSQTLYWIYTETEARSAQDLATLTGNIVALPNGTLVNP
jgi:hypothetical protein